MENCVSCSNEIFFEDKNMKCGHNMCLKCVDKKLEKCPTCHEDIIFLEKCCICMDKGVPEEELTVCKHAICSDCFENVESTICPCCRQDLVALKFTEEMKNKIEDKIKKSKKQSKDHEDIIIQISCKVFIEHFLNKIIIQFINFYDEILEDQDNYFKYLQVYISLFNRSFIFSEKDVDAVYNIFVEGYLSDFEDMPEKRIFDANLNSESPIDQELSGHVRAIESMVADMMLFGMVLGSQRRIPRTPANSRVVIRREFVNFDDTDEEDDEEDDEETEEDDDEETEEDDETDEIEKESTEEETEEDEETEEEAERDD